MDLPELQDTLRLDPAELVGAWRVGSRVYGTHGPGSDHDFLLILTGTGRRDLRFGPGLNAVLHDRGSFQRGLDEQSLLALEAWFAPPSHRLLEPARGAFHFVLDRAALVASSLARSERDFTAALRRFDEDVPAAHKRLFHSLRGLIFTRQLLTHGRLIDLTEGSCLLAELRAMPDREALERRFAPERHRLLQEVTAAGRSRR